MCNLQNVSLAVLFCSHITIFLNYFPVQLLECFFFYFLKLNNNVWLGDRSSCFCWVDIRVNGYFNNRR